MTAAVSPTTAGSSAPAAATGPAVATPRRARNPWPRRIGFFLLAVVLAAVWASVVQTQFNLQALAALGVEMPFGLRLRTTAQDLVGFAPMFALVVLGAWLPGWAVAAVLGRLWPAGRLVLYALAAGLSVAVALRLIDAAAPMPVLIDATRSLAGLLSMLAGCVAAGAAYARWTRSG
jgi:hypothetical protein